MSVRRYTTAAAGVFAATTVAGIGLVGADAAPPAKLPFITGGGHTQNFNSDGDPTDGPFYTNYGGFTARATAPGADAGEYVARGQVQGKTKENGTNASIGRVHGTVVCIANLGPSADNDGGGDPAGDVWEIRFRIERSDPAFPAGGPFYASLFVQDNGRVDYSDESFESAQLLNPNCGDVTEFQLEPHQGQITVHRG